MKSLVKGVYMIMFDIRYFFSISHHNITYLDVPGVYKKSGKVRASQENLDRLAEIHGHKK